MLTKNMLRLNAYAETLITTDQLLATLDGITPSPGLIFNVQNVTGGHFEYKFDVANTAIDSFYQGDMILGIIVFAPDTSGRIPSAQLQVSDGVRNSTWMPANISMMSTTTSTTSRAATFTSPAQPTPWITSQMTPINTTPQITSDRNSSSAGANTTAIAVGLALGGLLFALIIIGSIFWWRSRRRKKTAPLPITYMIVDGQNSHTVSILHKLPTRETDPYHAFLVVKLYNADNNEFIYQRYDLFRPDAENLRLGRSDVLSQGKATIGIAHNISIPATLSETEHQREFLRLILKNERASGIVFGIQPKHATWLHKEIQKDRHNPPNYLMLGNHSIIASSLGQSGHSCYTWAREKLYALATQFPEELGRIKYEPRLQRTLEDFVGSDTINHLEDKSYCC